MLALLKQSAPMLARNFGESFGGSPLRGSSPLSGASMLSCANPSPNYKQSPIAKLAQSHLTSHAASSNNSPSLNSKDEGDSSHNNTRKVSSQSNLPENSFFSGGCSLRLMRPIDSP